MISGGLAEPDRMIVGVGHIDVTRTVHRQPNRMIEPRRAPGTIETADHPRPTSQGSDDAIRSNLANGMISGISEEDIPRGMRRDGVGKTKLSGADNTIGVPRSSG